MDGPIHPVPRQKHFALGRHFKDNAPSIPVRVTRSPADPVQGRSARLPGIA